MPSPPLTRDEILDLDRRYLWHPYTALDDGPPPLVIAEARGAHLFDRDGRSFLDGNSSWWVAGLGHRHPRLVRALQQQAERMAHVCFAGITHEPAALLARDLVAVAPQGLTRVFFSDDGSTAVEAALKLAVQYHRQTGHPQKHRFVAVESAFHGETVGAASLGGVELFRRALGPLAFDVIRVPAPLAEGDEATDDEAFASAFTRLDEILTSAAHEIAAVVVEPLVLAAGGMRIYPAAYLSHLRRACDAHDVLLVADEVFTGYGRTGAMWACDHAGIAPDLLCTGKTFSGGMLPMAATLAGERVFAAFRGGRERAFLHGHSFTANPLGAAVARETLAVLRDEQVIEQVQRRAPRLAAAAHEAARRVRGARHPRALGFIAALDLDESGYLGGRGWRVYEEGLARGAYLRPLGGTVYLAPPLTISDDDLDQLCRVFVESVAAAG